VKDEQAFPMDLAKENSRLKLRIRELESCLEEANSPARIISSPDPEETGISYKTRFELLSEVQAQCKSGYLILNLQKEFIEYSPNILEVLGFPGTKAEITYSGYLSSIIPADRQKVGEIMHKLIAREDETSTTEFKVKGTDRFVQYIIQHCSVFHDTAYGDDCVFMILQNVTEQRRMERKLSHSENKFRRIFSSTPLGMIIYTIDTKGDLLLTDMNPAARQLLKIQDDSLIGKPIEIAFPALAKTSIPAEFKKVACDGDSWHGTNIEYSGDGRQYFVDISAFQTSLGTTAVIFQDITDKNQFENRLKESEEKYRTLVDNSNVAVFTSTPEGKIVFINDAGSHILEYNDKEELLRENTYRFYALKGARDLLLQQLRKRKEVSDFRAEFLTRNARSITVSISAKMENDMISGVFMDISEKVKAEQKLIDLNNELREINEKVNFINVELVRSKEKAEESDKLKSSFLANMSHEIRTPMNAILGFANLLKNKNFSDERKMTFIDIINSKSKQLLQIITDIIDISKIEAGQISIFNKSFPLNRMIQDLYLSFDNLRKQDNKPVTLHYSIGLPDGEDCLFSDKIRIEQILSNFLSNAYKFTNTGTIEVGYRIENAFITFFVKDTGIGIARGEQKVIFDRFRQVESSHSRSYSGTGLGLAISKGLAERMNGQIDVESETGKGSVFYLTLPYVKQPSVGSAEKAFDESSFDWSDKTILIAEDEEANYTFLEVLLKVTGARIMWAKNGLEAVSLCRRHSDINLVLMDIKMPLLDGLEATRQIKNLRTTLPVIVQTAYAMAADEDQCLKCGCDAYMPKPIKSEPLFKLIQEYI
jgi:PAS domain S-box-containing protein